MSKLIVLGLLRHKEMHGYEIQSIIQESRLDQWANVLSGSIYYSLNKMEEEGIIEAVKEERTGARIRKIYAITDRGREEYMRLLRESLRSRPHSLKSDFMLSLAFIEQLPRDEAVAILTGNLGRIEQTKAEWLAGKASKERTPAYNKLMQLSFDNAIQILEADARLMREAIAYLHD
jgi:DNA-binding PadR family transcriptional regulator